MGYTQTEGWGGSVNKTATVLDSSGSGTEREVMAQRGSGDGSAQSRLSHGEGEFLGWWR